MILQLTSGTHAIRHHATSPRAGIHTSYYCQMTIDERIEKLAERHEALAQTVELLVADSRELRSEMREMSHDTHEHAAQVLEMISQLVEVAKSHEQRLTNLEHPSNG